MFLALLLSLAVAVHDGDTIKLNGTSYRLQGIDAPELAQTCKNADGLKYECGKQSRDKLAEFLAGKKVECKSSGKDKYRRQIAVCYANGQDANRWMVANGYAIGYFEYTGTYAREAFKAKDAKLGIWQGEFLFPAKFRHQKRK